MPQLNLDDFQLQLGQVRTVSKDSGQTIESVELLLGDQTKAEMMINENLNIMNLIVRDTVLADIPQLQCAVNICPLSWKSRIWFPQAAKGSWWSR